MVRAGDDWRVESEKALKGARATCVCIGPGLRVSEWRQHEIEMAVAVTREKSDYRVIPVLLPRSDPASMPEFLSGRQWLDLRGGISVETVRPLIEALS